MVWGDAIDDIERLTSFDLERLDRVDLGGDDELAAAFEEAAGDREADLE